MVYCAQVACIAQFRGCMHSLHAEAACNGWPHVQILGRWQRALLQRMCALVSSDVMEDPVANLEAAIARNEIEWPQGEYVLLQSEHGDCCHVPSLPQSGHRFDGDFSV